MKQANKYYLYNNPDIKQEIRELKVSDDLTIINTRTYTGLRSSTKTVTDSYGLFWSGVAGAAGTLTATYKYTHETIDSPNHMTTLFHNANGYGSHVDDDFYELISTDGNWDTKESYSPEASVEFNLDRKLGYGIDMKIGKVTYTNHCEFDCYGINSFSWFE